MYHKYLLKREQCFHLSYVISLSSDNYFRPLKRQRPLVPFGRGPPWYSGTKLLPGGFAVQQGPEMEPGSWGRTVGRTLGPRSEAIVPI